MAISQLVLYGRIHSHNDYKRTQCRSDKYKVNGGPMTTGIAFGGPTLISVQIGHSRLSVEQGCKKADSGRTGEQAKEWTSDWTGTHEPESQ